MAGPSINKVFILGNLGGDPELRYTGSGKPVATFNVATSERGRGEDGEPRTEWHRIVAWDRLAEQCSQYLSKGRQVHIEGRIQTRSWEDRSGQKRYTTEIVASSVLFLSSGPGRGGGGDFGGPPPPDDGDYGGYDGGGGGGGGGRRGPQGDGGRGPAEPRGGGGGGDPQSEPEREIPYKDEDEDIPF